MRFMTAFAVSSWNITSIKIIYLLFSSCKSGGVLMGLFWLNGGFLFIYLFVCFISVTLCFLFDSHWSRHRSAAPSINDPRGIITLVPVRKPRSSLCSWCSCVSTNHEHESQRASDCWPSVDVQKVPDETIQKTLDCQVYKPMNVSAVHGDLFIDPIISHIVRSEQQQLKSFA